MLSSHDTDRIENEIFIFFRCYGKVFTEPLPSNEKKYALHQAHRNTQTGGRGLFMSAPLICTKEPLYAIPSFTEICSGIQNLIRADSQTHKQHADCITLLSFIKVRKVG
jgi:hypothetical protein